MFKYIIEDMRDWLRNPFKWNYFTYIFRRPYYRLRLFKRFLKYSYYGSWEIVNPMLEIPFEIFCEYYERNDIKNIGRVTSQGDFDLELCNNQNASYDEQDYLYLWFTEIKLQREKEIEILQDTWYEHHVSWFERIDTNYSRYVSFETKYAAYLFNMFREEENKFEKEKEEMLIRLIKIRNYLWK